MNNIVVIKEIVKRFYSKYDAYVNPLLKFLLALIVFGTINSKLGYMERLDSFLIVLVVALLCSFLPMVMMSILAGLFILAHLYALSMECALIAGVVLFLMFILYIRLVPNETTVVLLTPILFLLKIPYVLPIALGLLGGPASVVSVAFGVIIAHILEFVNKNADTILTIDDGNMVSRIKFIVEGMLANKSMIFMIVAFAITIVLVYTLRRRPIDYCWMIATVAGAVADMIILLIAGSAFDLDISFVSVFLGTILAIITGFILQFFEFHLDYKNTENVQFEDDDYYYYVKAVPKVVSSTPKKTRKAPSQAQAQAARREAARAQGARPAGKEPASADRARTVHTANGTTRQIKNRE